MWVSLLPWAAPLQSWHQTCSSFWWVGAPAFSDPTGKGWQRLAE